jgi:hypothetical protein
VIVKAASGAGLSAGAEPPLLSILLNRMAGLVTSWVPVSTPACGFASNYNSVSICSRPGLRNLPFR